MDGGWLHPLFCLQAGMVLIDQTGTIQVAWLYQYASVAGSYRAERGKITGLKSGVMIVYWTHFPAGFLSLLLSVSLFHFVPFFFFTYFLSSVALLDSDPALINFTFTHSWKLEAL